MNYTDEQRMAEIQFKIQVMDMISPLMVGTGLWVLLGIWVVFLIRIYQERAWLVFILAFGWGLGAQWFVRANINYRWVDEPELYVLHEAWLKGIENGQPVIPMHNIWGQRWKYMCISLPYRNMYWYEGGDYTVQQALGVANEKGLGDYDKNELFVGDRKNYFVLSPNFGRFKLKTMQRFAYREYYHRLKGQGYTWMFFHKERPEIEVDQGCYNLSDISIRFIKK